MINYTQIFIIYHIVNNSMKPIFSMMRISKKKKDNIHGAFSLIS